MVYSDTVTKLGLLQDCEVKLFGDNAYGQITGNTNRLYQFTARINRRQDKFFQLALTADGTWQLADTNDTDYKIAKRNLVSGQRDYQFALDMLVIDKVLVLTAASGGLWREIKPIDIHDDDSDVTRSYLENNSGNVGVPTNYDKMANSVVCQPTPNYNATLGLQVWFKGGPNYFVYNDTTKVPGFASIFHEYLSAGASLDYAIDRNMTEKINTLFPKVDAMEKAIVAFFSNRKKDERNQMMPYYQNNK